MNWTTAQAQRRAAEDEVLRLQGVKNQFDMLLSNLRESVENLAGEIEAIDGRIQENEVRNAAAEQTVADREEVRRQAAAYRRRPSYPGRASWPSPDNCLRLSPPTRRSWLPSTPTGRALRRAADLRTLAAELSW